mmetsp:Transcript_30204/g.66013  ORF Transcript_30204/g.66013 Transcript_30204/m.66013 type:complete len:317 (-) Transcript_30204:149-1099(-)
MSDNFEIKRKVRTIESSDQKVDDYIIKTKVVPSVASDLQKGEVDKEETNTTDSMPPKKIGIKIMTPMMREAAAATACVKNSTGSVQRHKAMALQIRDQRLLPRFTKTIPLKMQYLGMILDGSKTVEGRINTGMPAQCRKNDSILFFSGDTCCLTKVTDKMQFPTFREMLSHYTIKSCLPDFKGDLDAAEKLYRSFPGYAEKEARFGVLGLELRLATEEELSNMASASNSARGHDERGHNRGHEERGRNGNGNREGNGDFRRGRERYDGDRRQSGSSLGSGSHRGDRSRSRDRHNDHSRDRHYDARKERRHNNDTRR